MTGLPRGMSRQRIARLVAEDIEDGWTVNLGIGIPTLVARCLPAGKDVLLHSENGIVGMSPLPPGAPADPDLVNASKELVGLVTGAAITDSSWSFAMMRGGHLDLTVLGAFQVSQAGDIANWHDGREDSVPGVGGAMDLVAGARRAWVAMEHVTRAGAPRIVPRCTLPLTGRGVVGRVYTNLARIELADGGATATAIVAGLSFDALQAATGIPLRRAEACAVIDPGDDAA